MREIAVELFVLVWFVYLFVYSLIPLVLQDTSEMVHRFTGDIFHM